MRYFDSIIILTTCLITKFAFRGLGQHLGFQEKKFYKLENKALVGNVTVTRRVKDYFDCSFLCLEQGPLGCLSFNLGRDNDNGYYKCELSSSERYLEPDRMQERPGYDYYGTTSASLFRLMPCVSSPCSNGGTCIHDTRLGEFSCQCGVEITVLPFIDDVCNVETNNYTIGTSHQGVFNAQVGRYNLNYYDAWRLCEILGAALATYNQLYAAWEAGFEHCLHGWLADETIRLPMQTERAGCGRKIGVLGSSKPRDKDIKSNAWCYKKK